MCPYRAALAAIIVLIIVLVACVCAGEGMAPSEGEPFRPRQPGRGNRLWRSEDYYWHRAGWPYLTAPGPGQPDTPMWWWRYPGYAAPLELSLPLQGFHNYLYGYPPVSRLPYNE